MENESNVNVKETECSEPKETQEKAPVKRKVKLWSLLIIAAAVAAAIIIAFFATSALNDRKLQEQLDLGAKYVDELDYEAAVVAYKAAIEIDETCVEAYIGAADAYIELEDYENAKAILAQGLEKVPETYITSDDTEANAKEAIQAKLDEIQAIEDEIAAREAAIRAAEEAGEKGAEEAAAGDFLSQNGLVVTPASSVTSIMVYWEQKAEAVSVPATVTVTTTDNGDGYSDTNLILEIDANGVITGDEYHYEWGVDYFDRYTGNLLKAEEDGDLGLSVNDNQKRDDANTSCILNINNAFYKISVSQTLESLKVKNVRETITVHHPTHYDGITFLICEGSGTDDKDENEDESNLFDVEGFLETECGMLFTATDN